jgi:hypothetical protein
MNTTPTAEKRIILSLDNGGWSAEFINDLDIYQLFDTNIIPTAFTRYATEEEVVRIISQLNPNHIVEVRR